VAVPVHQCLIEFVRRLHQGGKSAMYNCVIAVTVGDLVCESEETAAVDDASTETVTTDQPCDE